MLPGFFVAVAARIGFAQSYVAARTFRETFCAIVVLARFHLRMLRHSGAHTAVHGAVKTAACATSRSLDAPGVLHTVVSTGRRADAGLPSQMRLKKPWLANHL